MSTLSTIITSIIASGTVTAGVHMSGAWPFERHLPIDAPAGIVWIDNTGTGTAIRAQSLDGIALETIGLSTFDGNVVIYGSVRIADGTEGAGKVLVSSADGTARWVRPPAPEASQYAVFVDQKPPSTSGGDSVGGTWTVRDLNTATAFNGTAISLDGDTATITLDPGTYFVEASAPARDVASHMIRLRNVSTASTAIVGTSEVTDNDSDDNDVTRSFLAGYITVEGPEAETFRIEHRCASTVSNGLGYSLNFDEPSIYTMVHIRKVD